MDLILNHRNINTPIKTILMTVKSEIKGSYLKDIIDKGDNILCTCPFHKEGLERTPACNVLNTKSIAEVEYGTYYCFACKAAGPLSKLIGKCFDQDEIEQQSFGEQWLLERFGNVFIQEQEYLPEIELNKSSTNLLENTLENYVYDDPRAIRYLTEKRRISPEVIQYFRIGFNKKTDSITFPCWNEKNKLVGVFERNIYTKHFHIPEISPKPVYLLNEIIKNNYTTVYVVESQINALTLWSWGIPAVALFGTGSKEQYEILHRSGIRNFILAFDGDEAGRRGRDKFIKNMSYDTLVSYIDLPEGKDVNDLTYQEFINLPQFNI